MLLHVRAVGCCSSCPGFGAVCTADTLECVRKLSEVIDVSTVSHAGTPLSELLEVSTREALERLRARARDDNSRERKPEDVATAEHSELDSRDGLGPAAA